MAEPTTRDITYWLNSRGYYSVGPRHVTLYDYDTEEGVTFDSDMLAADPLADACAWAAKFMREVPSPDDVGFDECGRLADLWFDKNGYTAPKDFSTSDDV